MNTITTTTEEAPRSLLNYFGAWLAADDNETLDELYARIDKETAAS